MSEGSSKSQPSKDISDPAVVVVWDPAFVTEEQYAELIEAIGNVVRAHGGLGVKLLRPSTLGAAVETEVVL